MPMIHHTEEKDYLGNRMGRQFWRRVYVVAFLWFDPRASGFLNEYGRNNQLTRFHRGESPEFHGWNSDCDFVQRYQPPLYMSTRKLSPMDGDPIHPINISVPWTKIKYLLSIFFISLSCILPLPIMDLSTIGPDAASRGWILETAHAVEVMQKDTNLELQHDTVLDEVWSLCNKYFLDQSFNHHNWNKIRSYYEEQLPLTIRPSDGQVLYDDEKAMKLASAMVATLNDKYSRILDRESYARIQKYDLIGIGATLMPESDNTIDEKNPTTLASSGESEPASMSTNSPESNTIRKKIRRIMVGAPPVPGSAADKAGIRAGDFITAVNGVPTAGRTAFDIIDQISQDPNMNTITMTVMSPRTVENLDRTSSGTSTGMRETDLEYSVRDVTMERETAKVMNPVTYLISERRKDGTVVGYIRISEFNSLVKPRLQEALIQLEKDGANAYVLDLRSNPGGAFQSAVEISGLFMDNKLATKVIDANKVELPFRTANHDTIIKPSHPIVIWVDGGSASASEVLAGALHDQCRAVVAGSSNSFGKGLIQAVYGLKNGYGLVLTVARYVTPNGFEIQGTGIAPDLRVNLPLFTIPGTPFTSDINFNDAISKMSPPSCVAPE